MIASWADCRRYLAADLARHGGRSALLRQPQVRWLVRLRLTEWWCNTRGGLVGGVLRWRLQAAGVKLGYTIPINRIGPALRLPHVGTIVVNGSARVGEFCQLLPDVVLGGNDRGVPTLGDHVYVGPGVKVIGAVTVGDGAVLAAGAVVTRDVPAGETWAGVPARRISTS